LIADCKYTIGYSTRVLTDNDEMTIIRPTEQL